MAALLRLRTILVGMLASSSFLTLILVPALMSGDDDVDDTITLIFLVVLVVVGWVVITINWYARLRRLNNSIKNIYNQHVTLTTTGIRYEVHNCSHGGFFHTTVQIPYDEIRSIRRQQRSRCSAFWHGSSSCILVVNRVDGYGFMFLCIIDEDEFVNMVQSRMTTSRGGVGPDDDDRDEQQQLKLYEKKQTDYQATTSITSTANTTTTSATSSNKAGDDDSSTSFALTKEDEELGMEFWVNSKNNSRPDHFLLMAQGVPSIVISRSSCLPH